mmetsp:Transcript_1394/g.8599  ORF Transcript_1394/g.8599 Transcript_1394/m.8599 type:complete len:248 (-) Transcript_1394:331-1074(-)
MPQLGLSSEPSTYPMHRFAVSQSPSCTVPCSQELGQQLFHVWRAQCGHFHWKGLPRSSLGFGGPKRNVPVGHFAVCPGLLCFGGPSLPSLFLAILLLFLVFVFLRFDLCGLRQGHECIQPIGHVFFLLNVFEQLSFPFGTRERPSGRWRCTCFPRAHVRSCGSLCFLRLRLGRASGGPSQCCEGGRERRSPRRSFPFGQAGLSRPKIWRPRAVFGGKAPVALRFFLHVFVSVLHQGRESQGRHGPFR